MQPRRGEIYAEQAYAQGKMLDNSGWELPRNITPSDVDLCFDDNGRLLVCELQRDASEWCEVKTGQHRLYEALAKGGCICCLLRHSVPVGRKIDTRNDIVSFQAMVVIEGRLVFSRVLPGSLWPWFVEVEFFGDRVRDVSRNGNPFRFYARKAV